MARKVVKSARQYTEMALDEIKLLQRTIASVALLDHFQFRHNGPHGALLCMVFEVLGESMLAAH